MLLGLHGSAGIPLWWDIYHSPSQERIEPQYMHYLCPHTSFPRCMCAHAIKTTVAPLTRFWAHIRLGNYMHGCKCFMCIDLDINPLTPKFISWKQPFPGIEHVAHFPISPLTLRPLHWGQTSQDKCVQVAAAFDAINDIHDSHGGVAWGVRSGDMPKLPDNSSSNRRREKLSLKCDTWSTSNLGFFWRGRLPTIHRGCFRLFTNLKKPAGGEGVLPPSNPHI